MEQIHLAPGSYRLPGTLVVSGRLVIRGAGLVPVGDRVTSGTQDARLSDRVGEQVLAEDRAAD